MIHVSLAQAKNQLSALIDRVEGGETVAVTRRGKPAARLVRVPSSGTDAPEAQRLQVQEAFVRLGSLRQGVVLEGEIKALARQGLD
ncbi:MAG: type II toxin-antitoxin system Phd/YefM family antitoxin [Pseudomonadota bacterium]|jgi:prevent-host-death family protein